MFIKLFSFLFMILNTASLFTEQKNPKVVVIGAGIAGLTAAHCLHQKGIDVYVYEARNRVGGRILTANIEGNLVELGAQNVSDGGESENLRRLIDEFGLELTGNPVNVSHLLYDSNEKLIPLKDLIKERKFDPTNLKIQLEEIAARSENMQQVLKELFREENFSYKAFSVMLASYEGGTIEKLSSSYAKTLYHMLLGGIAAAHPGQEQEENYIDLLSIRGGNALLPEKIAQELKGRVVLNMPLKKVSKTSTDSYLLHFDDGQKVETDILVLAIPCSVFENITFENNLIPQEKIEAIKQIKYGTNAKIMIPFPKAPSERIGIINDRSISFFDVDRTMLTVYYVGEASRFSANTMQKTYCQEQALLERGFGDLFSSSLTPTFARDNSFVFYEGPVGYSWTNDPYAKGSYSYIGSGQDSLLTTLRKEEGELVRTLFEPIEKKLYFAGEHASILLEVPGTMEAACESGARVARMIEHAFRYCSHESD